jgi:general secretion pathway protein C
VTARQIKGLFLVFNLALAILTAFFFAAAVKNLFAFTDSMPEPLVDSPPGEVTGNHPKIKPYREYEALRKSNLFGALSSSNVAPKKTIEENLPETTLELELLGCASTGDPETSFSIIRNKKTRKEDTYTVGDFIVGDARVEEIRKTEVVISRAGRRETLSMEFGRGGSVGRAVPPSSRRVFGRNYRSRISPTISSSRSNQPAIRVRSKNIRVINREKLTEEVSENLGSLMNQFRTEPNIVDNEPSGIRVNAIGSDSISRQSGLEPGDIVKRINGVRVNSLEDVLGLSDRLQQAREIRVVIERSGRHTTLIYKMQ